MSDSQRITAWRARQTRDRNGERSIDKEKVRVAPSKLSMPYQAAYAFCSGSDVVVSDAQWCEFLDALYEVEGVRP